MTEDKNKQTIDYYIKQQGQRSFNALNDPRCVDKGKIDVDKGRVISQEIAKRHIILKVKLRVQTWSQTSEALCNPKENNLTIKYTVLNVHTLFIGRKYSTLPLRFQVKMLLK